MAYRKKLDEFHIDEFGARSKRQRVTIAAHVGRGTVAPVEAGKAPSRDDHGASRNRNCAAVGDRKSTGAVDYTVRDQEIAYAQIANAPDCGTALHLRPQRPGHRRSGVQEVDIDAAWTVVAGCLGLAEPAILMSGPSDVPCVHLLNSCRRLLAQDRGKALIAKSASCGERISEVTVPVVVHLIAEGGGHRHLRHNSRAAAADQAAIDEHRIRAAIVGSDRGRHACRTRADNEHAGFEMHVIISVVHSGTVAAAGGPLQSRP